jgi:uncharacterized phage protein (TIGR01671 family)
MREIKFRAWDGEQKKMFTLSSLDMNPRFHKWGEESGRQVMLSHDVPVMQFTGLKDKNGKEIYEGDVVQRKFDSIDDTGSIIYRDNAFGIDFGKHIDFGEIGHDPFMRYIEVIGNVWENPDLLTV